MVYSHSQWEELPGRDGLQGQEGSWPQGCTIILKSEAAAYEKTDIHSLSESEQTGTEL